MGHRLRAQHGRCVGPKIRAVLADPRVARDLRVADSLHLTLAEFDALDPLERELWIEDRAAKQSECLSCGNLREKCAEHGKDWYSFRQVCYATMEREAAKEAYDALHVDAQYHDGTFQRWSKVRSHQHPYRYDAGVTIGAAETDLTPWDKFTTERSASPQSPETARDRGSDRESDLDALDQRVGSEGESAHRNDDAEPQ